MIIADAIQLLQKGKENVLPLKLLNSRNKQKIADLEAELKDLSKQLKTLKERSPNSLQRWPFLTCRKMHFTAFQFESAECRAISGPSQAVASFKQ